VTEEQRDDAESGENGEATTRPSPRNPFAGPEERAEFERAPALIETKKSAALLGVIVGLIAVLLVSAICIVGAIAFG
jgi:ABC-type amino acid transport system permease subunit